MNDWGDDRELLCHCHGVPAGVVRAVVRETRARDPKIVGARCKAGTGCRSCLPDIEVVIRQERARRTWNWFGFLRRLWPRARGAGKP